MSFHDLFSHDSAAYREARPRYPSELFDWIASMANGHDLAWDCACGNGQATVPLARHFEKVVGTDASMAQLDAAEPAPNVEYRVARAESSGLSANSVDVVTCAQAAHWFDHRAFHAEVERVLKPGGLLVLWTYGIHTVSPEVDDPMGEFYSQIVGPYWPPERSHVDEHYRNLPFPFSQIDSPSFEMRHEWTVAQLFAYVSTWSASKGYRDARGHDPVELIAERVLDAWGDPERVRMVRWPLTVLAGYAGASSGS